MEPTYALFMTIAKLVLIIIFAIIPFLFSVFSNISTKFHKVFFIAGRIVSILLAISSERSHQSLTFYRDFFSAIMFYPPKLPRQVAKSINYE